MAGSTLGITQAGLTATVANQTKTYGGDDSSLGGVGVTLSGLVNNAGIVTWNGAVGVNDSALTSTATALTRVAGEDVGSRSITAGSFTTPSGNYSAPTLVAGSTLGITPALLAVTAGDARRPAGAANPAFSAIFSGFKLLDGPGSLGGLLAFSTPASISSPEGQYRITPLGLNATNYSIAFVDGVLNVTVPASTANGGVGAAISSIVAPAAIVPATVPIVRAGGDFFNSLPPTSAGPAPADEGNPDATPGSGGAGGSGAAPEGAGVDVIPVSPTVAVGGCGVNLPAGACRPR